MRTTTPRKDNRFTRIPAAKVARMRGDKKNGDSLRVIAARHHVSESTVSLYCRDLYSNPQRVYPTEVAYRAAVVARGRGRDHSARHPCVDCGNKIRAEHVRCESCNLVYQREDGHLRKFLDSSKATQFRVGHKPLNSPKQKQKRNRAGNTWLPNPERKSKKEQPPIKSEPCDKSPTGCHYWIIDSKNVGRCKHCGKEKQFTTQAQAHPFNPY